MRFSWVVFGSLLLVGLGLGPAHAFKECDNCPEMVEVPTGSFMMGSPANEAGRLDREGPQHSVMIAKPFVVGKFHVTVDEFAAFAADTGYDAGTKCYVLEGGKYEEKEGRSWRTPGFPQTGSHPVVCLSWNDAKAYVDWLARRTGKGYRLLTEAEWEYAARAGSTSPHFFGSSENDLCRYANGADETAKRGIAGTEKWAFTPCKDGFAYTSPVGSFSPNKFGLYDMHGNAWQWTEDCYHDSYAGAPSDGSSGRDCSLRTLRGGSWVAGPPDLRSADRSGVNADARNFNVGFRVGRMLTP